MEDEKLHLAVREIYRHAVRKHRDGDAMAECIAVLRQHRPGTVDTDARKVIARMIAEEPRV